MKLSQAIAEITAVNVQLVKSKNEILSKFKELEDAAGNLDETTPEFDTVLGELKALVQGQDDLITDAPTEPPTP